MFKNYVSDHFKHIRAKTSENVQANAAHKVISRLIPQQSKYIKIDIDSSLPDNSYKVRTIILPLTQNNG